MQVKSIYPLSEISRRQIIVEPSKLALARRFPYGLHAKYLIVLECPSSRVAIHYHSLLFYAQIFIFLSELQEAIRTVPFNFVGHHETFQTRSSCP